MSGRMRVYVVLSVQKYTLIHTVLGMSMVSQLNWLLNKCYDRFLNKPNCKTI